MFKRFDIGINPRSLLHFGLSLAIVGCSSGNRLPKQLAWQQNWFGLSLGDTIPADASSKPVVSTKGLPGFPWQNAIGLATQHLNSKPTISVISLKTLCVPDWPIPNTPRSPEQARKLRVQYLNLPSVFVRHAAPPFCGNYPVISPADMYRYAAASLRLAEQRLGPPTRLVISPPFIQGELAELGVPTIQLTAQWLARRGSRKVTIAAFSASVDTICMAIFLPDLDIPSDKDALEPGFACLEPAYRDIARDPAELKSRELVAKAIGKSPYSRGPSMDQVITDEDYPIEALREGAEGTTGYQLDINTHGRVDSCEILQPSGSSSLDETTCYLLTRRVLIQPDKDVTGALKGGVFNGKHEWILPKG